MSSSHDGAPRGHRWRLAAGAALGALGVTLVLGAPVRAASVDPIPVATGPQTCATMAARFGVDPATWSEIRFTHSGGQTLPPGVLTKTARGNTVTVTLTAEGTVSFVSEQPIEAVYVNKGTYPNAANAIYRYVPPVTADTNLGLLPVTLSGVDHVVLCWTSATSPTTVPTTTVVPTTQPSPTTTAVLATTIVASTEVVSPTSVTGATTTAVARLPETGGPAGSTLLLAGLLLTSGLAALMVPLARRWP